MAEHILNERPLEGNSSERESTKVPNAAPSENNLGALYEAITISLHTVITHDDADDAAMCQRLARIAADHFRAFRDEEKRLPVALQCEKLFEIEALLHGAHDVSDATSERRAMLAKAMHAVDRATDILGSSPDWKADDLVEAGKRRCLSAPSACPGGDPWRTELAERAAWEIEAIAALVEKRLREFDQDQEELPLRALMRRAGRLACAQMSALSDHLATEDDVTTIVEQG